MMGAGVEPSRRAEHLLAVQGAGLDGRHWGTGSSGEWMDARRKKEIEATACFKDERTEIRRPESDAAQCVRA